MRVALALIILVVTTTSATTQSRHRGRELGIPFPGQPGPLNAITDVAGIAVGHVTLIEGEGKIVPGKGPIRTGVTAILPRPGQLGSGLCRDVQPERQRRHDRHQLDQGIGLHGRADPAHRDPQRGHRARRGHQVAVDNGRQFIFTYPIVAETFDFLNDANGEHVKPAHAIQALNNAKPGPVEEGAVGGGTGMGCNGFKGGIGTSSRKLPAEQGGFTLGVLVQCNYGGDFRILGVPIRTEITDLGM